MSSRAKAVAACTLSRVMLQNPRARNLISSQVRLIGSLPGPVSNIDQGNTTWEPSKRMERIKEAKPFSAFLTDGFGRRHDYLRISITERCNLRCVYCMPADGVELTPSDQVLSTDEIIRIAKLFVSEGVRKIRLTGGEPTVRKDIIELVEKLGQIDGLEEICMTSNGISLWRKMDKLKAAGLTHLNLSLDTLQEGKFMIMTRRKGLQQVLKSIARALELGIHPLKINTVIMRNRNEDEIIDFVKLTRDMPIEIRFIEYMPFDGNKWSNDKMISYREMLDIIRNQYPQLTKLDSIHDETAKLWQIPGFAGKIGFITSMSSHFCGSCTRLRLTGDGNLKVCLFGPNEVSLRDMMRTGASNEELLKIIGQAVGNKKEKHAGIGELEHLKNRPMVLIGDGGMLRRNWPIMEFARTKGYSLRRIHWYRSLKKSNDKDSDEFKKSLTHVTESGGAIMVDVSEKDNTIRIAKASGIIYFSNPIGIKLIRENENKKGDVLGTARIAGIMATKQTSNLIPLCHPIAISKVQVDVDIDDELNAIRVLCIVKCQGKTGVEMEALFGVITACTTIYDMNKAVDKNMIISDCKVIFKSGGKQDFEI